MGGRMTDNDLEGALAVAGLIPTSATAEQTAMADRFLQIHQGDTKKAGAALRLWLRNQQS